MEEQIKNKAMCLIVDDGYVLVGDGRSIKSNVRPVMSGNFYRVLGGHLEGNETGEEAVRRELREEAEIEIDNLKFLEVVDNKFTYEGEENHEIISLFIGEPGTKNMTKGKIIHRVEDTYEFDILWVPIKDILDGDRPLYPKFDYEKVLNT